MAQAVLQRPVSEPSDDQEFTSITNTRRQNTVSNTGMLRGFNSEDDDDVFVDPDAQNKLCQRRDTPLVKTMVKPGPVTVIPDLRKKKIILEEEEDEAVVTTNHTLHETKSDNIVQEKKNEGLIDSGREAIWQLKEKRAFNTVQCDKNKLQENESKRNPGTINQTGKFDDRKQDSDKDEDQHSVEESRKKELKLSPLMKIEEKFRAFTKKKTKRVDSNPHLNSRDGKEDPSAEILTSFESRPEIDDEDLRELKETLSKILGDDGETKKIRRHFVSQDTVAKCHPPSPHVTKVFKKAISDPTPSSSSKLTWNKGLMGSPRPLLAKGRFKLVNTQSLNSFAMKMRQAQDKGPVNSFSANCSAYSSVGDIRHMTHEERRRMLKKGMFRRDTPHSGDVSFDSIKGSLHQLHNADTVEEEESENELSTNQIPDMAATTDQPSTDAKVIQPRQDIIGQNTGHVTTGAVRFKDSDQADAGKSDHTVNGQGVRPKAKQLHRKNTPATLPTVQKLCNEVGHSEAVLEEEEEEEQEEDLQGATGGS